MESRQRLIRGMLLAGFLFALFFVFEFVFEWYRLDEPAMSAVSWAGKNNTKLVDLLSPMARAYNNVLPSSGKVLTGGVDANALQRPKRFFGAARNVEEGGSLTIIATALIDTGSRMDEVIFEEFKGTGNSEIHLDRRMGEKRVYPSILINKSGTRREELLLKPEILQKSWILRKLLYPMDEIEAMEFILDKMKSTKNNLDFFDMMRRGG